MYRRVYVYIYIFIYIYIHTIIAFITDGNLFANGTIQTGEWVNGVYTCVQVDLVCVNTKGPKV